MNLISGIFNLFVGFTNMAIGLNLSSCPKTNFIIGFLCIIIGIVNLVIFLKGKADE